MDALKKCKSQLSRARFSGFTKVYTSLWSKIVLELYGNEWEVVGPEEFYDVQVNFDGPMDFSSPSTSSPATQLTYEMSCKFSHSELPSGSDRNSWCLRFFSVRLIGSANTLKLRASKLKGSGATPEVAREKLVSALVKQWKAPDHKHVSKESKGESSKANESKDGESSKKKGKEAKDKTKDKAAKK